MHLREGGLDPIGRQTRAVVANDDLDRRGAAQHLASDRLRPVHERVLHQVRQDLLEPPGIRVDDGVEVPRQLDALDAGVVRQHAQGGRHGVGDLHRSR